MADHKVSVGDRSEAAAEVGNPAGAAPQLVKVEVTAENGIFKNGKLTKKGQKVELDPNTAARFIEAGEAKESK